MSTQPQIDHDRVQFLVDLHKITLIYLKQNLIPIPMATKVLEFIVDELQNAIGRNIVNPVAAAAQLKEPPSAV